MFCQTLCLRTAGCDLNETEHFCHFHLSFILRTLITHFAAGHTESLNGNDSIMPQMLLRNSFSCFFTSITFCSCLGSFVPCMMSTYCRYHGELRFKNCEFFYFSPVEASHCQATPLLPSNPCRL